MPKLPTYTVQAAGRANVIKLTKAEAAKLARRARQHGHQREAGQEGCLAASVRCPLCRDKVEALYWPHDNRAGARTPAQGLDRAMVEHLDEDCREVARP